jgi:hypothetical protein
VLPALVVVSLAVAAVVLTRWVLGRVDELGRHRPLPAWSISFWLSLALTFAVPVMRTALLERRLSDAASTVVGSPVLVHCQTLGESWLRAGGHLGWVSWGADGVPERRTVLAGSTCGHLRAWLGHRGTETTFDEMIAVHVLTHESMHMAGRLNEAEAECAAVQRDALTAILLGARPESAQTLARSYWLQAYPRMTEAYSSPSCVPGGGLDERVLWAPWG